MLQNPPGFFVALYHTELNLHLQISFFGRFKLKFLVEKKVETLEIQFLVHQEQLFCLNSIHELVIMEQTG